MENSSSFQGAKIKDINEKKEKKKYVDYPKVLKHFNNKYVFAFLIIIIITQFIIIYNLKQTNTKTEKRECVSNNYNDINIEEKQRYDINFSYNDYDKKIMTDKIIKDARWLLANKEAFFINGLIRKNKLKNCLEIGVAHGGSSILILNAIKDIENSFLVSLDINTHMIKYPERKIGYRVNKLFPELTKKWKLYTGDQPHKFLVNLNTKFDFLFLDSAHRLPGELINFIEALPFLKENAIVVVDDLLWHFHRSFRKKQKIEKFFPSCISLFPSIYGDKVFIKNSKVGISNI